MATYMSAVVKFKKVAKDWLTDADAPALITLENVAKQLDDGYDTPAMISQFGLTYRSLLKRQPTGDGEEVDPLDDIIPD